MKQINAIIKLVKEDIILEEIQKQNGVVGLTLCGVRGFEQISNLAEDDLLEPQNYSKIELIVKDEEAETIRDAIVNLAHTGLNGDGLVTIFSIESTCRIATKEYL